MFTFIKKIWERIKQVFSSNAFEFEESERRVSATEQGFDKQIQIAEKHIEIINALDTTPEIKNILIKFEKTHQVKYQTYKELIQDEKNASVLRETLMSQYNRLESQIDGNIYDEQLRVEMRAIADLYTLNGCDRSIVDLYNEMEDFIDEKRKLLSIESNPCFPRVKISSTYQIMPYENRVYNFAKDLEILQENPKKFYHLCDSLFEIEDLELHHIPMPGKDFTIYRDTKNKIEYVMLYSGKWQINTYDPRVI
jgi:hypothetical protein